MRGVAGRRHDPSAPEYTTLNKDGKAVWEPGLPAEVTSRRVHRPVRKEAPEEVSISCDLKITLRMTPQGRAEWLERALRGIQQSRAKVQDVFNVITHPKFVSGVPDRIGRRMLRRVAESLEIFSEKQRVTLVAKCKLAELFQASGSGADGEVDDEADDAQPERVDGLRQLEEEPKQQAKLSRRSKSRSARSRSVNSDRRVRRSRSRRRLADRGTRSKHDSTATGMKLHSSDMKQPSETIKATMQSATDVVRTERLTSEERAALEVAFRRRQRQQEEDRKKQETDKKKFEERERQRKARLGAAFLVGDEEEEVDEAAKAWAVTGAVLVRKSQQEKGRTEELAYGGLSSNTATVALERVRTPAAPAGGGQDPRFIEAMGGDNLLREAQAILRSAADSGRLGAAPPRYHSPARGGRRRERSYSPRGPDMRSSGSYRSPTPDGRARGQARAARKAKMIACLMGMDRH